MRLKKQIMICAAIILCIGGLSGCSGGGTPQMANELNFSLDGISELTISYDEENIAFLQGNENQLVVKEYMSKDSDKYYAEVDQSGGSIQISEGSKPFFSSGFSRYIEVYLPASYKENLTVTTTNGNIDFSGAEVSAENLRVDSTAGAITLKNSTASSMHLSTTEGSLNLANLKADQIRLETTSGATSCDQLEGKITYTTTSGSADMKGTIGSGSYRAENSGRLNVTYADVKGDLSLFNKNDNVNLTVPSDLSFQFKGTTKNGSISTNFQQAITVNGRTASGTVGKDPKVTIETETKNGNIQVTK